MSYEVALFGLGACVVAYNNLANLWPMYQKNGIYITGNLAMTGVLIVVAGTILGVVVFCP